ncbi:MAG: hypothetical protein WC277_08365 [Bacilli bacterium]
MRWTTPINVRPALLLLLLFCCICCGASADSVTVNFQSLGLMQQDIKLFDDAGALVTTANTTSSVTLNGTESAFYTVQIQPSATNQDPVSLLDAIIAWLTQNAIIVGLLLVVLLVIARRR